MPHLPVDAEGFLKRGLAATATATRGNGTQARYNTRRMQRGDASTKRRCAPHEVEKA
jgi:hypothetical protein